MALLVAGLALLALAAPAQACSLAYFPYQAASGSEDLRYIDGTELRVVRSGVETAAESGFFLSYAEAGGPDRILVAGQDGLGADCSGDGWLRLRSGDSLLWQEDGAAHVFRAAGGPYAQLGRDLFRLQGDTLEPLGITLAQDDYVLGFAPWGEPVVAGNGGVRVGGVQVLDGQYPAVASSDDVLALAYHDGEQAVLALLRERSSTMEVLRFPARVGLVDVRWADGWYVLAGERAHFVEGRDRGVQDLGVDADAVGDLAGEALVFTGDGYVRYEGVTPVGAARHEPPLWLPMRAPEAGSESDLPNQWTDVALPRPLAGPGEGGGAGGGADIPLPGAALVLAALGTALARRRGR